MTMDRHRTSRLLHNPYKKLHKRLVNFVENADLDPDLLARNEYLRLENMILRGMAYKTTSIIRFSLEEKEQLARAAIRLQGRTKVNVSLLSPRQILRYAYTMARKRYSSLGPTKKPRTRLGRQYHQAVLQTIIDAHPTWGKVRIWQEMEKHFHGIKRFYVYDMLYQIGFWDSKKVHPGLAWKEFLAKFEGVTWAGDFFTVDVWTEYGLITHYVLFFIHLATQRVVIAGITPHATEDWLINILRAWTDGESPFGTDARFLIRDHDRRYTKYVDWYFAKMGMSPTRISPGAPVMNYHAEHFVYKIKHECLSHCIFLSEKALKQVIDAYVYYYHNQRPNKKFNGGCIMENETHWLEDGKITQAELIPGLLNYYYRTVPDASLEK